MRPGGKVKAEHLDWIIGALIPIIAFILILLALKLTAGKRASFGSIIFTTGMISLPLTGYALFVLLVSKMEFKTLAALETLGHLMIVASVCLITFVALLTKAALVSVLEFSRKAAFWLVPATILAVGYLSYWIGKLFD